MTALTTQFWVTLNFTSDWHIGTGQGRVGAVDAEVRRDADGLPFVPAKTLVGVWRDACERVADTLDRDGGAGEWSAWVTWLFGSQPARPNDPTAQEYRAPIPAALQLTPARAPAMLREAVHRRPALQQAAVVLRPGVAIDSLTGTAVDGMLRLEERAICGSQLIATAQLGEDRNGGPGLLPAAELLLRAGARLIESVGGKRHRGAGRVEVQLHITEPPDRELLTPPAGVPGPDLRLNALLDQLLDPTKPLRSPEPPKADRRATAVHPATGSAGNWATWRLRLVVETPVVIADGVAGNVIETRDTISGTALLGTVLGHTALRSAKGALESTTLGLGDIRIGDAVPAGPDGAPAYATPLTWQRNDKGRSAAVVNVAITPSDARSRTMSGRIASASQVGDKTERRWQHVTISKAISTHAIIDDEARRPTTDSGGVFVYLGIEPGTTLISDIVLPAGTELTLGEGQELRFGRSRKDDFGLVRVVEQPERVQPAEPTAAVPLGDGAPLHIWCISDVLVRNDRLSPDPSAHQLARTIAEALGQSPDDVVVKQQWIKVARREGFGVAWGRPRSSHLALAAGSVVIMQLPSRPDPQRLADLELLGIGERQAEGFGRVRFNPPELDGGEPQVVFKGGVTDGFEEPTIVSDTRPQWPDLPPHSLELAAWRRAIASAAARAANPGTQADPKPEAVLPGITPDKAAGMKAQLGGLRSLLPKLALPNGHQQVQHWIDSTGTFKKRRELWGKDCLSDLESLVGSQSPNSGLVWRLLGLDGRQEQLTLGPERADLIRTELRVEATIVLLTETLCHLTHTGDKS